MKKIFADPFNKSWYSVFIDLVDIIGGRAYAQFLAETEPLYSDIVVVDSFEDVIKFESLYGTLNLQNNPFLFIVSTKQKSRFNIDTEKFFAFDEYLCLCDSEMIAHYISSIVMPYVVKRETMLCSNSMKIFPQSSSHFDYLFENFEPIFSDGS